MTHRRIGLFRAAALLLGLILAALALETAARVFSPLNRFSAYLHQPYAKFELRHNLRHTAPVARFTTNQWGMRGEDPPLRFDEHYTVLALGGSTTQCMYLDDESVWTRRVEKNLRKRGVPAWIGNAAYDGHSTRGNLHVMNEVVRRVKPDAVLILAGVNDLALSLVKDDPERPLPPESPTYRILSISRALQLARLWFRALFRQSVAVDVTSHSNYVPRPLESPSAASDVAESDLVQLTEFRSNIRRLIAIGREEKIETIFLTQPMLYSDDPRWDGVRGELYWIAEPRFGAIPASRMWELMEIYNSALREICREEKVPCLDLAAAIPHDEEFFYDPCHFTDRGAEEVARIVEAFLLK